MQTEYETLTSRRRKFEFFFDTYFRHPGDMFVYEWGELETYTVLRIRLLDSSESIFVITFDYSNHPEFVYVAMWGWRKGNPAICNANLDGNQIEDFEILFSVLKSVGKDVLFVY